MDVLLLMGGASAEREISLLSGKAVQAALLNLGHRVTVHDPIDAPPASDALQRHDVVFLALHGTGGEDGQIQGILEQAAVPFTGSNADASQIAFHKGQSKTRFLQAGLATPDSEQFHIDEPLHEILDRASRLTCPWFVKPVAQGSSLGVSKVDSPDGLASAVNSVRKLDRSGLIEEAISGTEWTVGLFDSVTFPPVAIQAHREFNNYAAKYEQAAAKHTINRGPATEAEKQLMAVAREAYQAVGATGLARVDLICDEQGNPWILEVNTIPGMTETSTVPKAAAAFGWSLGELCERMCAAAIERQHHRNWTSDA